MKNLIKTGLLILTIGLSQIGFAQDKSVKSFIKSYKSAPDANYISAKSGEDFNLETSGLSGISPFLNNIGEIKMVSVSTSSKIKSDFKRLKSKLNQRYDVMININDSDGGISVFTDEDNGYLYGLIQGDENIIVVSVESKD